LECYACQLKKENIFPIARALVTSAASKPAARQKTKFLSLFSLKNIVVVAALKRGGGERPEGGRWGNSDKPVIHGSGHRGINYNLFTLASRLHPHLAVIDCYEGMEGEGPAAGTPVYSRVCVVSPGWLAADCVALELMGTEKGPLMRMYYCSQSVHTRISLTDLCSGRRLQPTDSDNSRAAAA